MKVGRYLLRSTPPGNGVVIHQKKLSIRSFTSSWSSVVRFSSVRAHASPPIFLLLSMWVIRLKIKRVKAFFLEKWAKKTWTLIRTVDQYYELSPTHFMPIDHLQVFSMKSKGLKCSTWLRAWSHIITSIMKHRTRQAKINMLLICLAPYTTIRLLHLPHTNDVYTTARAAKYPHHTSGPAINNRGRVESRNVSDVPGIPKPWPPTHQPLRFFILLAEQL